MISYELTDEQEIIRSTMRNFAQEKLAPNARRLDLESGLDETALDTIWSTGLVPMQADADGVSPLTVSLVLEEIAAADPSASLALASIVGFVRAISEQGSARQRGDMLKLFAGDRPHVAALAAIEPGFASDIDDMKTRADRSGDEYRLNGAKMVPLAARCAHFLVFAESDRARMALIVPAEAPGVTVEESRGMLGLRALEIAKVTFEDVRVNDAMVLGEGAKVDTRRILDGTRIALAAVMTGLCRSVLDYVVPYTKDRVVHGTPLAQKQKIAFDIADMRIDIDAIRWMTWKAAWELENDGSATRSSRLAHIYACDRTMVHADNGLQAMGGHGFVQDHPMEMYYRNARSLASLDNIAGV